MRDLAGLRQQFERSKARMEMLRQTCGDALTTRQHQNGQWVKVPWKTLASEAIHYYALLIADIDAGTYVWRYRGVMGRDA